ncbi:MAG: A24 family peptidase [Rubripirellula sp.]
MATFLSDQMFLPVMAALSASLIATVTDIRSLRIRNTLTVPLLVSGIVFHCWMEGWSGLTVSVAGIGIGFAVLILPYLMGILGAGDVKLLMGMGAWLGGHNTALVALFGCFAMGFVAVVVLAKREGSKAVWYNLQLSILRLQTIRRHLFASQGELKDIKSMASDPAQRHNLVPFSIMLAMGSVALVGILLVG